MKKLRKTLLILVSTFLALNACKTLNKIEQAKESLSNINAKKSLNEEIKKNNFSQSNWPSSLKEGWLDSGTAQALITSDTSFGKEVIKENCRKRLAWLLFLDSYNVNREYKEMSSKLATSSTFKNFGKEVIYEKESNGKYWLIVKREATDLRAQWEDIMKRAEKRDSKLKSLRKQKDNF